jgi:hypothetical protein
MSYHYDQMTSQRVEHYVYCGECGRTISGSPGAGCHDRSLCIDCQDKMRHAIEKEEKKLQEGE